LFASIHASSRSERCVAEKLAAARSMTFDECATAYIRAHEGSWRNPKHRQQWRNTLDTHPGADGVTMEATGVYQSA
jgi:hypothetical protein